MTKVEYDIKLVNEETQKETVVTKNLQLVVTNNVILLRDQNNYNLFTLNKNTGHFQVYYDNGYSEDGVEFGFIRDNDSAYNTSSEFKLRTKGLCCPHGEEEVNDDDEEEYDEEEEDEDDDEFWDDDDEEDDDDEDDEDCNCDGCDDDKLNEDNNKATGVNVSFSISRNN